MKTREQKAAEIYSYGRDCVMEGGNSLRSLARHIAVMVFGNDDHEPGLWKSRQWPDQTIHLDRFEDYLLRPAREGLGVPSLKWLRRVLDAHPEKDEREEALRAVRQEVPDFDERADAEERKEAVRDARANREGPGAPEGKSNNPNGRRGKDEETNGVSNTISSSRRDHGSTNRLAIIGRLKRDRPDLLDKVESGELTPNAAAIEAGFRRRKIQVEPDPQAVQRMLDNHLPGWRLWNPETGEELGH